MIALLEFVRYSQKMLRISEKQTEYTIDWYRYYSKKYGSENVWLSQDSNGVNYIVVKGAEIEDKPFNVQKQFSSTQSLSASELESVPF